MLKPQKLKADYRIEINRYMHEEIRINESWDQSGKAAHSERYEEGFIWSELYGQNKGPFDKWACNYEMSLEGGKGTVESLFENHFSAEKIRRKGLLFVYPDEDFAGSQEDYWKKDPVISWLYYKQKFDAVFPVLCEHGMTGLDMELEATGDDGRKFRFVYSTAASGKLYVDGKYLLNICFYDEKYADSNYPQPFVAGRPEKTENGKTAVTLYGVYSFSDLLTALEMAGRQDADRD